MNLVRLPNYMANKKAPARKSKKQHTPDFYPVVRKIRLADNVNGALNGTHAGDAGQLLSISNRRLYRYAKLYQLKIDLDIQTAVAGDAIVEVYALANNWDVQRALALAKKIYDEAYADELEVAGATSARWRDFRVASGVLNAGVLDPIQYDNRTLAETVQDVGEHAVSTGDVGGTDMAFTWGAGSGSQIDIVNEWIESGRINNDPAVSGTTAPYAGVNNDQMSDNELEALNSDGNSPPYSSTGFSDQLVKVATLYFRPGAIGMQKLSSGYFDAPCGLFVLKTNVSLGNGTLTMTAKSGDYKGVHALSMCQE